MLCYEKLLDLQKSDKLQNTEYMKTLRVYLEHNLNTVQSAKALFIHRSTFLYRLERIKSILETDLEDPDELFYLNLSFRLLDNEEMYGFLHSVAILKGFYLIYTDLQTAAFPVIIRSGKKELVHQQPFMRLYGYSSCTRSQGGIAYAHKKAKLIRNRPGRETGPLCKSV